jgi:1-acyl-sn-glycerol-3-phosphate acyltransferase
MGIHDLRARVGAAALSAGWFLSSPYCRQTRYNLKDLMPGFLVVDSHTCGRRVLAEKAVAILAGAGTAELIGIEGLAAAVGRLKPQALVYFCRYRSQGGCDVPDLKEARRVFEAAAEVPRVVLVGSAAVYSARPENPGLIREAAGRPQHLAAADPALPWIELEEAAESALGPQRLILLRAAATPVTGGCDYFSSFFTGRIAVALMGHDPSLQILDPDDLAQAVDLAARHVVGGAYNIAPDGVVPLKQALRLVGSTRLALGWPGGQHQYIRYSWTVANDKAKEDLGFAPRHSSWEALARLTGSAAADPGFDEYGMDPAYVAAYGRTLLKFLEKAYWRIEMDGFERIPTSGPAIMAGVHRGFMPLDAVMFFHLAVQHRGRYPRFLIHPTLVKFAGQFNFITKLGGVIACQDNADRVLAADGLLGIYPEGIRGTFQHYRDSHTVGRFGRNSFVKMALRHRVPIVPFVNVGAAEIFPIVARLDWKWWKSFSLWPFFPIAPPFPLLPVPLPSKWHIQVLEPLHVEKEYPPEAAEDRAVVNHISGQVRERLQAAYDDLRRRRPNAFFGSVFSKG